MNPTFQKTLCFNNIIPDTVNRAISHRFDASGKGVNVARVLSQLGKKALHLTQLGGALRSLFLELCKKDDLDVHWVESGSEIRFAYTIIDSPTVTELVEEGDPVDPGTEERIFVAYKGILEGNREKAPGTVIISGKNAKGFSDALIPSMVRLAREQDKRIILDIRGNDLQQSLSFQPDIIKPNLYEFIETFMKDYDSPKEITGDEPGVKENVAALALELAAKHKTTIVLTRGELSVWYTDGKVFSEVPVKANEPINSTGSGDAFTAGLAAALHDGLLLPEAIAQGIYNGSINANLLKPGAIFADI